MGTVAQFNRFLRNLIRTMKPLSIACSLLFLLATGWAPWVIAQSNDDPVISYEVDLADVKNHYIQIRMRVPAAGETTQLMLPAWTPGSYLVREYARNIDTLSAETVDGKPLTIEKTRKNRWQVKTAGLKEFVVNYRVYCREASVRTNFVNNEYAVLNGAATFLTVPDLMDSRHTVALKMPKNWQRSATALRPSAETANAYTAENYDEIVDSPIVAGNLKIYPFQVGGIQHFLVNVGEQGKWDGDQAAKDLAKMVDAHHKIWGTIPYKQYHFLNVIGNGGGGLEHDNSCLVMTGRWTYRDKSRYKRWLSLASHEFFHTWNVRRLRPKPLVKYDYENEVYTKSLWIAEGVTSYYENLALARAGLLSTRELISGLSQDIQSVQSTPGRKKQSLKESSYDTWIKFYRPDENASNTRISYYSKGAVVAFLLDAKIRSMTDGQKSLDDVIRIMFERFQENGYLPSDFRAVASVVAGSDLNPFFVSAVDRTDDLDFDEALDYFGMNFSGRPRPAKKPKVDEADKPGNPETPTTENPQRTASKIPWLGAKTADNVITSVTAESPATEAGLNPDDEIIAINGYRLSSSLDSWINKYKVGDELDFLVNRGGRIINLAVTLGSRPNNTWRLSINRKQSDEEKARIKAWAEGIVTPEKTDPQPADQ